MGYSSIIVVGQKRTDKEVGPPDSDFMLLRYTADGILDKDFGNQGITVSDFGSITEILRLVEQKADGSILVAGELENKQRNSDFIIVRYLSNGMIDTTFGIEGKTILDFNNGDDRLQNMKLEADGKITLVGTSKNRIKDDIALVRFDSNGVLDPTFGSDGIVLTDLSGSNNIVFQTEDRVYDVLHKSDGHILLCGYSFGANSSESKSFFAQYDKNGMLDEKFGTKGVQIIGARDSLIVGVLASQSDEKIIARGLKYLPTDIVFFVTRYLNDLNVGTLNFSVNNHSALVYPNPIESVATLEYTLEKDENLTIQLMDLQGRVIKTFVENRLQKAGDYQQSIELPNDLVEGVYFLRLVSPNGQLAVKIIK